MVKKSILCSMLVYFILSLFVLISLDCNGKFIKIKPNLSTLSLQIEFPGDVSLVLCKVKLIDNSNVFKGLFIYKNDTINIEIPGHVIYKLIKLMPFDNDIVRHDGEPYTIALERADNSVIGQIQTDSFKIYLDYKGTYPKTISDEFPITEILKTSNRPIVYDHECTNNIGICLIEELIKLKDTIE